MALDTLDDLALSVADGVAIDWDRMLDPTGGPPELAALRLIETIAAGHRTDADTNEGS